MVTAPLLQVNAVATAVFLPLASSPPTLLLWLFVCEYVRACVYVCDMWWKLENPAG